MAVLSYTGSPLVDTGIDVLLALTEKDRPEDVTTEDIEAQFEFLVGSYLKKPWRKDLYNLFPHSAWTHYPICKEPDDKIKKSYLGFCRKLLAGITEIDSGFSQGVPGKRCYACTERAAFYPLTPISDKNSGQGAHKVVMPMGGSGALSNFYALGNDGEPLCAACALCIQFMPLGAWKFYDRSDVDGKPKLYYSLSRSANPLFNRWVVDKAVDYHRNVMASGNDGEGVYHQLSSRKDNSLCRMAMQYARTCSILADDEPDDEDDDFRLETTARIYAFNNFNQGPQMKVFEIPDRIFDFLGRIYVGDAKRVQEWHNVIRANFVFRNGNGTDPDTDEEGCYNSVYNRVFDRLVSGKSILYCLYDKSVRTLYGSIEIAEIYLKGVHGLDAQSLNAARNIADNIAKWVREHGSLKKDLFRLEAECKNQFQLRRSLAYFSRKYALAYGEPLMGLEDPGTLTVLYGDENGDASWSDFPTFIRLRLYEVLAPEIREAISSGEIEEEDVELEEEE